MFGFFKRKKLQSNIVKLENVILNKSETVYHWYEKIDKEKCYGIHTTVKGIPLEIGKDGSTVAKIRYVGIPNAVVYFHLKIINLTGEYVSCNRTVDIHVNAAICMNATKGICKEYKFELLPSFNQGGMLACV